MGGGEVKGVGWGGGSGSGGGGVCVHVCLCVCMCGWVGGWGVRPWWRRLGLAASWGRLWRRGDQLARRLGEGDPLCSYRPSWLILLLPRHGQ